ncbi:hypothetical protein KSS87_019214 [Heliosperma pusillum]|nr:hypothetical protein KSS87_019214 [Heliosperma pusillum]
MEFMRQLDKTRQTTVAGWAFWGWRRSDMVGAVEMVVARVRAEMILSFSDSNLKPTSRGLSTMALQEKLSGDIGGLTKLRSMSLISLSYSDYLKFLRLESCDYKSDVGNERVLATGAGVVIGATVGSICVVDIAMLTLSKIRPSNGEYVLKLQYAFYNDGNKEDLEDVEVGGRSGGSNEHGHKYG